MLNRRKIQSIAPSRRELKMKTCVAQQKFYLLFLPLNIIIHSSTCYLSIEMDQIDNYKKLCDRHYRFPIFFDWLASNLTDFYRLFSIDYTRDYTVSKLLTCYVLITVLLTNTDEEKKRHNKNGFHCSEPESSIFYFKICSAPSEWPRSCVVWVYLTLGWLYLANQWHH